MRKSILTKDVLISREIEYLIETGMFSEGDKLPSERVLADRFDVQRGTVRNAMRLLIDRGLIEARDRSGYYVAASRIRFDKDQYNSRKSIIEQTGKTAYVKLLSFEKTVLPEKMAEKVSELQLEGKVAYEKLPPDVQVYRIMRLRFVNGEPIGIERTNIRGDLVADLQGEDVHDQSIYQMLNEKYNIKMKRALTRITAVYANGLESELLSVDMKKPVMRYEGIVYDSEGRLIEYFDDILLKEKVEFFSNEVDI